MNSAHDFSWLSVDEKLSNWLQNDRKKEELVEIVDAKIHGVFALKMWKPEFCKLFVEELEKLESLGVKAKSPNSMNKYGMVSIFCAFVNS